MWSTEHSIETETSPDAIWRLWSDVASWPDWNDDIERIEISGPFAVGSTISMTPVGQDTVDLQRMVDRAFPGAVLNIPQAGRTARFSMTYPEVPQRIFEPGSSSLPASEP